MALVYTKRSATHSTNYAHKPTVGITLHDTEGATDLTTYGSAGGWHWLVGRKLDSRTGMAHLYRDVEEFRAPWHVASTDEWRPPFLLRAPDGRVSDPNYCTIGIEIVSCQAFRDIGLPYTDEQYAALRALLGDLYARYGPLPVVTHGAMQLNRTDPVAFDFAKANLVPSSADARVFYYQRGDTVVDISDEELKAYFEQLGIQVNMDTALMQRASLAYRRGETRGPAMSGEYAVRAPTGHDAVRQNFTAGICEWDAVTGGTGWVEVVAHPEAI